MPEVFDSSESKENSINTILTSIIFNPYLTHSEYHLPQIYLL